MKVRYVLSRRRKNFHSRIKLHELVRKAFWLEFEKESILNFLEKYKIIEGSQQSLSKIKPKIQGYIEIENDPDFVINVLEFSHS